MTEKTLIRIQHGNEASEAQVAPQQINSISTGTKDTVRVQLSADALPTPEELLQRELEALEQDPNVAAHFVGDGVMKAIS